MSNHSSVGKAGLRPLWRYIGGMVVRPRATLDRLAAESTIRWAVLLQALGLLIGWGNVALFALAGQDWLGTIAIRRVQKIPWWAAILTMTTALALWILLVSTLVR